MSCKVSQCFRWLFQYFWRYKGVAETWTKALENKKIAYFCLPKIIMNTTDYHFYLKTNVNICPQIQSNNSSTIVELVN